MATRNHVAVRLDDETLTRIDAIRPLLGSEWRDATRSDVLRLLLLDALAHVEKKHRAEFGVTSRRGRRSVEAPATPARRRRKKRAPPAD
jgi:hypothetical protein